MKRLLLLPAALAAVPAPPPRPAPARAAPPGACYDVSRGQPAELTGTVSYALYAGPPEFADVQRGDSPEPSYVLLLARPICLTGDHEFADPDTRFRRVQLVPPDGGEGRLRGLVGHRATLGFSERLAAETGHHHEPLVAWVRDARSLDGPAPALPSRRAADWDVPARPGFRPLDRTDEYGTPATAVRAFYEALGDGQGAAASALVVPEKRRLPAFSPAGLDRFYAVLPRPLALAGIAKGPNGTWVARYRYGAPGGRACDGRAGVTTARRGGRDYVAAVRPLDGC